MNLSKVKVTVFVPSLCGGGAERVMILIANGLASRGGVVELVVLGPYGEYVDQVSPLVNLRRLGGSRMLSSLPRLVKYLRTASPDFLISALDYANVCSLLAVKMARTKTKVIITEHSTLSLTMKLNPSIKHSLMLSLIRYTYPGAAKIIAVSNGVAEDLAKIADIPREKIVTVYNPVVTADMLSLSYQAVDHTWIGSASVPVILGVGRLTVAKDFACLIRAFALLRQNRAAKLIILGEGELRAELTLLVEELGILEDVDMPGFVANPYAWMRKADVFVMSSAYEGLGNVLIEAMACGVPVVSTDCRSGPAEILEDGIWGRMVPVGDTVSLFRAINETLEDHSCINAAGRASQFSVEKAVDRYSDILVNL